VRHAVDECATECVPFAWSTQPGKMLTPAGKGYLPTDPELWADRVVCRRLLRRLNQELDYEDTRARNLVLGELMGG